MHALAVPQPAPTTSPTSFILTPPHSPFQLFPRLYADLYIPAMAVWTYCVLIGIATLLRAGPAGGFKPETIYNSVSVLVRGARQGSRSGTAVQPQEVGPPMSVRCMLCHWDCAHPQAPLCSGC